MAFPDTIDSFATLTDNVDTIFASIPNERGTAITNIETALGTSLSNIFITGEVRMFGGPIADIPTGWLFCNGAAVSRTTYADLFEVIGTGYGAGDTTTTFNLPDLRDFHFVGASEDASGVAISNISGSSEKTGGSVTSDSASSTGGAQSGGNAGSNTHTHSFYLPYVAVTPMIKT